MPAISQRQPPVYIEYDSNTGRKPKRFSDAFQARRFYSQQFKLGNKPKVLKELTMTTATATKPTTKKSKATKATRATKKPVAKKVAKKPTAKAKLSSGLKPCQTKILSVLKDGRERNRLYICEKSSVRSSAITYYLGSTNPEKRKHNDTTRFPSLISLGFVKAEVHDIKEKDVVLFSITSKGKKEISK